MIKNDLAETSLSLKDFAYALPKERIAQHPVEPRDSSRLMVIDRAKQGVEHRIFRDITEYIRPEDVLVINDTRVLPARIIGHRVFNAAQAAAGDLSAPAKTSVELLLLRQRGCDEWETLAGPGKRAMTGDILEFGDGILRAEIKSVMPDGNRLVHFTAGKDAQTVYDALHMVGTMPLPPYITEKLEDSERYQTVYSREEGSAAAPTAGLHFTEELLEEIRGMGVKIAEGTLHVGLGTFRPVKVEHIQDHHMHSEFFMISREAADIINETKDSGGRVICVGTTSCRTVESASTDDGILQAKTGWTEIFIYPGYRFKVLDALITNFHLPESTLVMLVSALAGRGHILDAYKEAVKERYRFFSFGDAMFIASSPVAQKR